jgi:hypothetical protein
LAVGAGTSDPRALRLPATLTAGTVLVSAAAFIVATLAWLLMTVEALGASARAEPLSSELLDLHRYASAAFLTGIGALFASIAGSPRARWAS